MKSIDDQIKILVDIRDNLEKRKDEIIQIEFPELADKIKAISSAIFTLESIKDK